jgi:NADP-dependent 3-hydroxy acid dehydrogenase YdfG
MTTKQKTIILTGASPIIGAAAPHLFLDCGYNVVDNEQNYPISRVLKAKITLDARLV